ncbi:MAG: phosphoglucosamine mutase [Alphaproteobacteria bacterium]|nr:phosphoglucosamine mutase [Alphaproteobacteria bacterium]
MTRKYFGTDGIRGQSNRAPMTAATALRVGMAAGRRFTRGAHRHRVVIGKDTRLSGYMFEPALTAGFIAVGMDVTLLGPLPTPAVAMLTRSLRADLGVMISASHNPYADNGIKLFGPDGFKLSDAIEAEVEAMIDGDAEAGLAPPEGLGRAQRLDDASGRYIEFAKRTFPEGRGLAGLKIAIDCAHGAAYRVAPTVLWELGARIVPIGVAPDGFNINQDCGSTHVATLAAEVKAKGCDLGIALDGDADRMILVDDKGATVDGDQVMALIAGDWQRRGRLKGGAVVATVMSNLGLERWLRERDLALIRTQVGDRYVVEAMRADGCNVGGEQSGHMVLTDYVTTGDGLIAALQVLAAAVEVGRPLSEFGRVFEPLPQLLVNVRFDQGSKPLDSAPVKAAIAAAEAKLGAAGRVLIRKSGTEPLIRVMAEGEDPALVRRVVDDIAGAIDRAAR